MFTVIAGIVYFTPIMALASTTPVPWVPTDTTSLVIDLDFIDEDYSLVIVDAGKDPTADPVLVVADGSFAINVISFGSDSATVSGGSTALFLGTDLAFDFYFYDNDTGAYSSDYGIDQDGDFIGLFYNGTTFYVTNSAQVPIPTAGLLLGTGLIGLIGFRRRIMNR